MPLHGKVKLKICNSRHFLEGLNQLLKKRYQDKSGEKKDELYFFSFQKVLILTIYVATV